MNIIDFANPMNFWWALIALPIIALYILKVRLRRIPASTLMFWNQLYDEKKPRAWWQRLRHWLSLLLQLAFVALLVTALVDPLWSWQKEQQRRIVLVLDNSASMQAIDAAGQSRLDAARTAAVMQVHSMRDGDQMALVTAGGRPRVAWGLTDHGRWLADAISETAATDGPTAIADSIQLARRLLSGFEGESEIIVITDGCSNELAQFQDDATVHLIGVGESQDNIGITRYQVRRSLTDAIGYQVLVDVTNFADAPVECRLELDLEGELVDVLPIAMEAGETITRIVDHTSAAGGRLLAQLDRADALAVDNTALAILPKREPIPITLVTQGNLFVGSVLASIPLVELTVVSEYQESQEKPARVYVFDRQVPDKLPRGPVLVVDPQNECELWTLAGEVEQPVVAAVDNESPLTQHVRLDNVLFPGAKRLQFTGEAQPLIRDPFDEPLFARISRRGGDVVVLSCSLEKGDLPLRIAFPVLMKNTIEWFEGESGQLRPAATCGELVSLPLSEPAAHDAVVSSGEADERDDEAILLAANDKTESVPYELVSPEGDVTPITSGGGQATIGPLLKTGLWILRPVTATVDATTTASASDTSSESAFEGADSLPSEQANPLEAEDVVGIACNLASAEESDLRPVLELPRAEQTRVALLGGRSLWFYLTLLAAGLIAAEWWLYQRRIVG